MKNLKKIVLSGKEVWPIIEGGKGIGASDGRSAGAFASAGAVGTISGASTMGFSESDGKYIPHTYSGKTRSMKHKELVDQTIEHTVDHIDLAHRTSQGRGAIHMNVLWEMGGSEAILYGVLSKVKGKLDGITCGAGMPYSLLEIACKHEIYCYPIVSSMRAFRILWKRAYSKCPREFLGGVVYEDPWKAGGHNGISNAENPEISEAPFERVEAIRTFMNSVGLVDVPIIMAGGVWFLRDWQDWLDNPKIGPIAFQFGTRALLTQESPIPDQWKQRLFDINEGEVRLNRYSPTGFYSSALDNDFLKELRARSARQISYSDSPRDGMDSVLEYGVRKRKIYVNADDYVKAKIWMTEGYTAMLKTPDHTILLVTESKAAQIRYDQLDCKGCLSRCKFSSWDQEALTGTGIKPDPRSFCIQNTLRDAVIHGDVDNDLIFLGHSAYKFSSDPMYARRYIPTVKELVDAIVEGQ